MTFKFPAIDITDRADDRILYWDDAAGVHKYKDESAAGSLGAWTDFTPTLTASTTNPTVGNGTLAGRYKQLDATTYAIIISWEFGSTSNAGSGNYSFALPAGLTTGAVRQSLPGWIFDSSGGQWPCSGRIDGGGTSVFRIYHSNSAAASGILGHQSPMAWASGDRLALSGIIEVA